MLVVGRSLGGVLLRAHSSRALYSTTATPITEICSALNTRSSADQWLVGADRFSSAFSAGDAGVKEAMLLHLGAEFGVDTAAVDAAHQRFHKNPALASDVRTAATPLHFRLLQAVGNLPGGIKEVCELRAFILAHLRSSTRDRAQTAALRRVEESARELLTLWFCLGNLKLERLTWHSPGDILHKVAQYEAVHPVAGLGDIRRRVGPHRRCFYFSHEAMPREPLVMVHVALTREVADNVQKIMKVDDVSSPSEESDTTAIYYSISSTQKGLAGIDLGNLLIKRVVRELQRDSPQITVHSTLSPIPGLRSWIVRALHGHSSSECGDLLDATTLSSMRVISGKREMETEQAREMLIGWLSTQRVSRPQLESSEQMKTMLMRLTARYLYEARKGGAAVNPVANFHLRNGAELYRLNWMGDSSVRGLNNSLGMMVNYRYRLENVHANSAAYIHEGKIAANERVLKLIK